MSIRDDILTEMQQRLYRIGNESVRNPKDPPTSLPVTSLITGPDDTEKVTLTGGLPETQMRWSVTVVPYYLGSDGTDETAEKEYEVFMLRIIRAIFGLYADDTPNEDADPGLGGLCDNMYVQHIGELIKPYAADPGIGVQIDFVILHSLF